MAINDPPKDAGGDTDESIPPDPNDISDLHEMPTDILLSLLSCVESNAAQADIDYQEHGLDALKLEASLHRSKADQIQEELKRRRGV